MISATMPRPPSARARSTARPVLPVAVAPPITTSGGCAGLASAGAPGSRVSPSRAPGAPASRPRSPPLRSGRPPLRSGQPPAQAVRARADDADVDDAAQEVRRAGQVDQAVLARAAQAADPAVRQRRRKGILAGQRGRAPRSARPPSSSPSWSWARGAAIESTSTEATDPIRARLRSKPIASWTASRRLSRCALGSARNVVGQALGGRSRAAARTRPRRPGRSARFRGGAASPRTARPTRRRTRR